MDNAVGANGCLSGAYDSARSLGIARPETAPGPATNTAGGAGVVSVGIFYDGNYYQHITNHYAHEHPIGSRLSLKGLEGFIRSAVSAYEAVPDNLVSVTEAHYFRGRLWAEEARERDCLYSERIFEDQLMKAGIRQHYLPLANGAEKGVDVAFAMEVYEAAVRRGVNVAALITGDGDYVPLLKKLAACGVRTMILGWSLPARLDERGGEARGGAGVSGALLQAANYPLKMDEVIDASLGEELNGERRSGSSGSACCGTAHGAAATEALAPSWRNLFVGGHRLRPGESSVERTPKPDGSSTSRAGDIAPAPVENGPGGSVASASGTLPKSGVVAHDLPYEEGTVITLKDDGYGFIKPLAGGEDVFISRRAISRRIFDGLQAYQRVSFQRGQGEQGPYAVNLAAV